MAEMDTSTMEMKKLPSRNNNIEIDDTEVGDVEVVRSTTQRGLESRHAQMLAIAGTIGTGLFVGSGQALAVGGPVFLIVAYLIMTFLVFGIVTSNCRDGRISPCGGRLNGVLWSAIRVKESEFCHGLDVLVLFCHYRALRDYRCWHPHQL